MKQILLIAVFIGGCWVTALSDTIPEFNGDRPHSFGPVLAFFEFSVHIDRAENQPAYREMHAMTDLEQQFHLGQGLVVDGNLKDINWDKDLVFVRITEHTANGSEEVSLAMMRYTEEGMLVKDVNQTSEAFAMSVSVAD